MNPSLKAIASTSISGSSEPQSRVSPVYLAGVPMRDQHVLGLTRLLDDAGFDDTAEKLENGNKRSWPASCQTRELRLLGFPPGLGCESVFRVDRRL
jgi:hypothetical protein